MNELVKYDAACRAVAEAKSVDEVSAIRDRAEGMRAYARQAKNRELEVDAAEIRLRAERRLGELIRVQKETVGLNKGAAGGGKKDAPRGSYVEPRDTVPTLAEAGIDKKLSSRAQKMAAVPDAEFEAQIGDWRERVKNENERVTTSLVRAGERAQRDSELPKAIELPKGRYSVLYADPPWRYEFVESESRAIENQYPTMTLDDICALDIAGICNDDAILFLWATSPKLAEAMRVIDEWGFSYRSSAVWAKPQMGMGYYFRQQHEFLLIAMRGSVRAPEPANRPRSVYEAPRQKHSAKPPEFYSFIERMYPDLPRVELFARAEREGWEAWGNQSAAA